MINNSGRLPGYLGKILAGGVWAVVALGMVVDAPARAERFAGPIRIIDGDTLQLGGSGNLRLAAIDAPERDQTCQTAARGVFRCGAWLATWLGAQFDGRMAVCEGTARGGYGRPLVTCSVAGIGNLNAWLMRQGLVFPYRDDSTYAHEHEYAVLMARGLWAMKHVRNPHDHRNTPLGEGYTPVNLECAIKGNIGAPGKRIYHLPGKGSYGRTKIDLGAGERWFCSETEARAAGWRRARNIR